MKFLQFTAQQKKSTISAMLMLRNRTENRGKHHIYKRTYPEKKLRKVEEVKRGVVLVTDALQTALLLPMTCKST